MLLFLFGYRIIKIKNEDYLFAYMDHHTFHRGQIVITYKVVTGRSSKYRLLYISGESKKNYISFTGLSIVKTLYDLRTTSVEALMLSYREMGSP
jgi:hypothetical protein